VFILFLNLLFFQEHKQLHDQSELDAKLKYTQLCRSLRTYGVTFFLVKVKSKRIQIIVLVKKLFF
jgi:talin